MTPFLRKAVGQRWSNYATSFQSMCHNMFDHNTHNIALNINQWKTLYIRLLLPLSSTIRFTLNLFRAISVHEQQEKKKKERKEKGEKNMHKLQEWYFLFGRHTFLFYGYIPILWIHRHFPYINLYTVFFFLFQIEDGFKTTTEDQNQHIHKKSQKV